MMDRWHGRAGGRLLRRRSRALTLVETLIAAAIASGVSAGMATLMITVAREQKLSMVTYQVNQYADHLQDRIGYLLRSASRLHGTHLDDPVPDEDFFHKIYFKKAVYADPPEPTQSLTFDPDFNTLFHHPDAGDAASAIAISPGGQHGHFVRLENLRFRQALQWGGLAPNGAVVLVMFDVSDQGRARVSYRDTADRSNWVWVTRSFSVNLRRE